MRKLKIELDSGQTITVRPPTVKQYYKDRTQIKGDDDLFAFVALVYSRNDEGVTFTVDDILDFTIDDLNRFTDVYLAWVRNEKESDPN